MNFLNLKGNRILLEKIGEYGLNDMHEYSTNPLFYKNLEYGPSKNIDETKALLMKFINRANNVTGHYWFIKLKTENKIIGTFGLMNIDNKKGICEIGYGISPDHWGKGYFSEALKLILDYLFNKLNLQRIWAKTQSDNYSSINGLKRMGFIQKDIMKDYYKNQAGFQFDAVFLSLEKEEYIRTAK